MVALVLADALLEKFGGDNVVEIHHNVDAFVADLGRAIRESAAPTAGP